MAQAIKCVCEPQVEKKPFFYNMTCELTQRPKNERKKERNKQIKRNSGNNKNVRKVCC